MAILPKRVRNPNVSTQDVLGALNDLPNWTFRVAEDKNDARFRIEGKKGFHRVTVMRNKKGDFFVSRDTGCLATVLTLGILELISFVQRPQDEIFKCIRENFEASS